MSRILERTREYYNFVLGYMIDEYKKNGKGTHRYQVMKEIRGKFDDIPATVRQSTVERVSKSNRNFFRKKANFPRFKSENRYRSFEVRTYKQDYNFVDGKVRIWTKSIGSIRMKGFRPSESYGNGRVVKRASGWYFQYQATAKEKKVKKTLKKRVGLDMGLTSFLADSDGKTVKSLKFKNVGGKNRARIYEHIKNKRRDWLHKLSRVYADSYDFVAVEDLEIQRMMGNKRFSKGIGLAAWGTFHHMLDYKLKMLGKTMVRVNPRGTSQTCLCGQRVEKDITVRVHNCPACGIVEDRDIVSAKLIKKIAWDGHLASAKKLCIQ